MQASSLEYLSILYLSIQIDRTKQMLVLFLWRTLANTPAMNRKKIKLKKSCLYVFLDRIAPTSMSLRCQRSLSEEVAVGRGGRKGKRRGRKPRQKGNLHSSESLSCVFLLLICHGLNSASFSRLFHKFISENENVFLHLFVEYPLNNHSVPGM